MELCKRNLTSHFDLLFGSAFCGFGSGVVKEESPKRDHVKKPLNAFMIFMKEQREKVMSECTLKESSAINQILGRKVMSLNVY